MGDNYIGEIYELYDVNTGLMLYIGSTSYTIESRLIGHKYAIKNVNNYFYNYLRDNNIKIDIRCLETLWGVRENSRCQLLEREGFYQEKYQNVIMNKKRAGRKFQKIKNKEYKEKYIEKNPDKMKEYMKEYYKRDEVKERLDEYYKRDEVKERRNMLRLERMRDDTKREKRNESARLRYKKNKETQKKYYEQNKDKVKDKAKEYYQKNKENIKKNMKIKIN